MIDQYHYYAGYIPEPLRLPASVVPAASPRPKSSHGGRKSSGKPVSISESSDNLEQQGMTGKFFKYMELDDDDGAPRIII